MQDQNEKDKLLFLDSFRGMAALYVMIGHSRWLLWEGFSSGYLLHPKDYTLMDKTLMYFFSLFRFGHEAVILFFVLSGFVIHLRYAGNVLNGKIDFDFWNYLKRRSRRIYPPLFAAIFVTLFFDVIGAYLEFDIYKNSSIYNHLNENFSFDHSLRTLIGNVIFLMRFYVPVFGSNGPLWSLAYEGWFYILYPMFFLIERKSMILSFLMIVTLFLISNLLGLYAILFSKVFGLMITWWFGVILANIYVGRIKWSLNYFIPLIILIPLLGLEIIKLDFNYSSVLWALGFVGLFSFGLSNYLFSNISRMFRLLPWLGKISYSLYLIHLPALLFMSGIVMNYNGKLPSQSYYLIIGIFISLVISYPVYLIAEKPFTKNISVK